MNKVRHAFYMLGNSQEESLENCKKFNEITDAVEESTMLMELMNKCKDNKKVQYVNELLNLRSRND